MNPFYLHKNDASRVIFLFRTFIIAVCLISCCTAFSNPNKFFRKPFAVNHPPTVTAKVADSYCVGDYVEIQVVGKDVDGDILSYHVVEPTDKLPDGLELNSNTGLISGKLA